MMFLNLIVALIIGIYAVALIGFGIYCMYVTIDMLVKEIRSIE